MTPGQRREARVALAMLPVGVLVLVASALAFPLVAARALTAPLDGHPHFAWTEGWCLLAAAVALRNARAGIEMMSAFDWRPLPLVLLTSAAVVAGWLALP